MDFHLITNTGVCEFSEGSKVILSYAWSRKDWEYMTDRGQRLGRNWADAKAGAERLATERIKGVAKQIRRKT